MTDEHNTPTPDPTVLTTEALTRGLSSERDYTNGQVGIIQERLAGIDRATIVLNETVNRVPTDMEREITHVRELLGEKFATLPSQFQVMLEKFDSIGTQFKERDTRSERESRDNKVAVDAAFAAQKEAACLTVDSMILCADLTWRPAGDLLPGDELIGIDEESGDNASRRYRRSTVIANTMHREPLLRVVTEQGTVRCTSQHPWLVRRYRGHAWGWRRADELQPGDQVLRLMDVWDTDRSWDAGWLAGILDGEGCLTVDEKRRTRRVSIGQVEGMTADMIEAALKSRDVAISRHTRAAVASEHGGRSWTAQAQQRWQIGSRPDVMRLLGSVRPPRLLARSHLVWEGVPIRGQGRMVAVTAVESAGTGMISRLSTSTHTYIGEGFAMHNSEQNKSNTLAISKSEAATTETINKLNELFQTTVNALGDKIEDNKARLAALELLVTSGIGASTGVHDNRIDRRADTSQIMAIVMAIIAVFSVATAVYIATKG